MLDRAGLPLLATILLILGGCGSTTEARKAKAPYRQSVEQVCQSDLEKYGPHVKFGQARMKPCFNAHKDGLTLDCGMIMQTPKDSAHTPEGDVARFCAEVKPGDGQVIGCLEAKREQLTPECRRVVKRQLMDWEA